MLKVIKKGGKLVIVEPKNTLISKRVFKIFFNWKFKILYKKITKFIYRIISKIEKILWNEHIKFKRWTLKFLKKLFLKFITTSTASQRAK